MSKAQTAREIYFSESYYDLISADVSSKDFEDVYTFGFFLDPFCEFDSIIETQSQSIFISSISDN